jgi:hypothetical protein
MAAGVGETVKQVVPGLRKIRGILTGIWSDRAIWRLHCRILLKSDKWRRMFRPDRESSLTIGLPNRQEGRP